MLKFRFCKTYNKIVTYWWKRVNSILVEENMKVEENKAKVIFIDEEGVERVFEKCFLMPIEPILDNDKETQITSYTPNLTGPEFMLAITNLAHIAGHFLNLMDNNEE